MKRIPTVIGALAALVLLAILGIVLFIAPSPRARKAWKENAISEISSRVANPAWAARRVAELRQRPAGSPDDIDSWISQDLILMRNGDWLAYASICQKENQRIRDLYLARGSDRRWYYSTFHFCKGMIVLRGEEQPEDLAAFAKTYYLRTFDGRSDECLQQTWPKSK